MCGCLLLAPCVCCQLCLSLYRPLFCVICFLMTAPIFLSHILSIEKWTQERKLNLCYSKCRRYIRQLDWHSPSSFMASQFPLSLCVCMRACVCWKREEIDQHREERVHQQRLDGGCERERVSERKSEGCCCRLLLQYLTLGKQLQTGSNRQARHADRYRPGVMGRDGWGLGGWR